MAALSYEELAKVLFKLLSQCCRTCVPLTRYEMSFTEIKKLCERKKVPTSGANKDTLVLRLMKALPKPPGEEQIDTSVDLKMPLSEEAQRSLRLLHHWKRSYFSLLSSALLLPVIDCMRYLSPTDLESIVHVAWGHFRNFRTRSGETLDESMYRLVQLIVASKKESGELDQYLVTFSQPIAIEEARSSKFPMW